MILMEEHIHQIMFLRIPAHMDKIIKGIMEMVIENHLASKRRIQDGTIKAPQENAQFQPVLLEEADKQRWDRYQEHRCQEYVSIEVHPPPEAKPETLPQSLATSFKRRVRLIDLYENPAEYGTQYGEKKKQFDILLYSLKKIF
ncbi:hypothetical protein [Mitsuokella jalaludinii]|uniref:hypothetical protein n=1 Tax=Mitsuokella jalaludinii TaxID=187979 RepID=UPI003F9D670E